MKHKDSDPEGTDKDAEAATRMTFFQKNRPLESVIRLKSLDSNSEVIVTSVEELIQIISKGDNKFFVMGKAYLLNLNHKYDRKHEETSFSDPDHNYFRSRNSATSSADTPTLENSESREYVKPYLILPPVRI